MKRIVVATWNIHGAVGVDGRRVPARIADVLARTGADVIALQEFSSPVGARADLRAVLESRLAMHARVAVTFRDARREFGNALLSRWPLLEADDIDLSFGTREPRNAIEAMLAVEGAPLRIIATHLGLGAFERRAQAARLAGRLAERNIATILLGDFNEPRRSGSLAALRPHVAFGKPLATFPSVCPLLGLDRIFVTPPLRATLRVLRDRRSRIASDHLPLIADVEIDA